jgi:hypothetical protein
MSERKPEPWMESPQFIIDGLDEEDWQHYKAGKCICEARSVNECLCGAWELEIEE